MKGKQMSAWYKENHLVGNMNKYQAMIIGSKHKPSQLTLDINGHLINITEGLKLLGVTVDKDLHFSEHISTICKKASRLIGLTIPGLIKLFEQNAIHVAACKQH